MNNLDEEEFFINENQKDPIIISNDSENILEHTLSAIRSSYKLRNNEDIQEDVFGDESNDSWSSWLHRPNIYVLFVLVAFKVLAENMVLSIILDQTLQKISIYMKHHDPIDIQQEYTIFQSYTSIIQSLSGFIMCSYYANLSDMHGRVHVLKICAWWTILGSIANIYLYCFESVKYNRWIYIILYCVEGMNGGVLSLTAIGSSYIFDIADKTERFVKLSIFMSIIYGAIGIGPLIGSFLVAKNFLDNAKMIYLASIINGLYFLGCSFLLKESRKEHDRRESQTIYNLQQQERKNQKNNLNWKQRLLHSLNFKHEVIDLFKPLKTLWVPKTHLGSLIPRFNVLVLIFIEIFVNGFIEGCVPAVIAFAMFEFNWTSVEIGWFYSISGIIRCLVLLIVVPNLLHFLQKKLPVLNDSIDRIDKTYLNFFLLFSVLGFMSMILIQSATGVYLNAVFLSLTAFAIPTIQNVIIKYSSKKNTSVVFAGIAILRNLVQLVTPPILLKIYSITLLSDPLKFLYIPLIFSIFSVFLLKLVRIIEDEDLLARESIYEYEETNLLETNDTFSENTTSYGSLTKNKKNTSIEPQNILPKTRSKSLNINNPQPPSSSSLANLSSTFNNKRGSMYSRLGIHEGENSFKSQSFIPSPLLKNIDNKSKSVSSSLKI